MAIVGPQHRKKTKYLCYYESDTQYRDNPTEMVTICTVALVR